MKLEVGMYVRTKNGFIDKIILVDYAEEEKQNYPNHPSKNHWRDKILLSKVGYWRTTQNILKASYNIIDLIEEGDYVNGRYVDKYKGKLVVFTELPNGKWTTIDLDNEHYYIGSVLTKEQFKSMEYTIGE